MQLQYPEKELFTSAEVGLSQKLILQIRGELETFTTHQPTFSVHKRHPPLQIGKDGRILRRTDTQTESRYRIV